MHINYVISTYNFLAYPARPISPACQRSWEQGIDILNKPIQIQVTHAVLTLSFQRQF